MPARARNLATTIALTCVMAILLCLAQTASAVATKSPEKTASGIFFADPNIYTWEIAPESQQSQWEIALAATPTASGRQVWLSADPIGEEGGINLYAYVKNDPLGKWDPLGLNDKPKKNLNCEGFNSKTSDPRDVQKALDEARKAGQRGRADALKAILKTLKRNAKFCVPIQAFLNAFEQEFGPMFPETPINPETGLPINMS